MTFTKLDRGIAQSSIMAEPPVVFKVFVTVLAMSDPDGIARVSPVFLATVCHLLLDEVHAALSKLEMPDPESRSLEAEGRRIRRVDGGFLVINYLKYRGRSLKEAEAERKRLYRQNVKAGSNREEVGPQVSGQCPDASPSPFSHSNSHEEGCGEGQDGDGLLPIPRNLPFAEKDPLTVWRADIREHARLLKKGRTHIGPSRLTKETVDQEIAAFNLRIRDLS